MSTLAGGLPELAPREVEAEPSSALELAAIAAVAGIRRVHFMSWRDLGDPEAGGSELHAHMIASHWAAAGIDVTFRTSAIAGAPKPLPGAATGCCGAPAATASSPPPPGRASAWGIVPGTLWSRSGTACRSCRRSGIAVLAWSSCTMSTPRCGAWSCHPPSPVPGSPWSDAWPRALPQQPRGHSLGVLAH